jgi:glucose/arabinose dehydrogenase
MGREVRLGRAAALPVMLAALVAGAPTGGAAPVPQAHNRATAAAISFTRTTFVVPSPTAIARAPDGRIFITSMLGNIHVLRINRSGGVVPGSHKVIRTLGEQLTLGIAVDPRSTKKRTIIWVSHSSPRVDTHDAPPDSSGVTRLTGRNFARRRDVITGLPRSTHDHAVNEIHFGPDRKLYIAQGGNTGAGAAFAGDKEFPGLRREQPLSAAILVASVLARNFDGSCHNRDNIYGKPPCDVRPYATGLRNAYDFVFHSNGRMYAPDNGLGLQGSYPPKPTPPCASPGDPARFNPGVQDDYLFRIVRGGYYGHPNPSRRQCVWGDGSDQGVAPLPNYHRPVLDLGSRRSADGIIEYHGRHFGIRGDLLVANWSNGDDITRVNIAGRAVRGSSPLPVPRIAGETKDFQNPLALANGPGGAIYVAEHGADRVSVLLPTS